MSKGALVGALVVILVGGVLALAIARRDPPREQIDRVREAVGHAQRACEHVDELAALIARNASVDEVFAALNAADDAADEAAALDAYWTALAGATGAIRIALEDDDPGAARVGARSARAECARVRDAR